MALSLIVEEEHGTFSKRERRHNGYYGGDFSTLPFPTTPIGPAKVLPSGPCHPGPQRFR